MSVYVGACEYTTVEMASASLGRIIGAYPDIQLVGNSLLGSMISYIQQRSRRLSSAAQELFIVK